MKAAEMAGFVFDNVEPLHDKILGNQYRASAYLNDGTYLPCVIFQSRRTQVALALRRFKELRWKRSQYEAVVESFVTGHSNVAYYQIKTIESSPFAWPLEILKTIKGETSMGWTAFVAEMKDGKQFSFGTSFRFEFFELPPGYAHSDIAKIHSGKVYSETLGLQDFSIEGMRQVQTLREKPFFSCYLKELDGKIR
jgi:hypothetical protein